MSKNKHGLPRHIPKLAKEKIRELCGYGCIICGGIPYDYDHFETEFHECTEHDINDIVLLCDKHHREKEAIGVEVIKGFLRDSPPKGRNVRFDPTILTEDFKIIWPSISIDAHENNILIDGEEVLSIAKTGNPLNPIRLDGIFHDDRGNKICSVNENQLTVYQQLLGDITCVNNRFVFKASSGRVILAFRMEPKKLVIEELYVIKNRSFIIGNQEQFIFGNGNSYGDLSNARILHARKAINLISGTKPLFFNDSELILPRRSLYMPRMLSVYCDTAITFGSDIIRM